MIFRKSFSKPILPHYYQTFLFIRVKFNSCKIYPGVAWPVSHQMFLYVRIPKECGTNSHNFIEISPIKICNKFDSKNGFWPQIFAKIQEIQNNIKINFYSFFIYLFILVVLFIRSHKQMDKNFLTHLHTKYTDIFKHLQLEISNLNCFPQLCFLRLMSTHLKYFLKFLTKWFEYIFRLIDFFLIFGEKLVLFSKKQKKGTNIWVGSKRFHKKLFWYPYKNVF